MKKEDVFVLIQLRTDLVNFMTAHSALTETLTDYGIDVELDDLIGENYPFTESFDEMKVKLWVRTSVDSINNILQNH